MIAETKRLIQHIKEGVLYDDVLLEEVHRVPALKPHRYEIRSAYVGSLDAARKLSLELPTRAVRLTKEDKTKILLTKGAQGGGS